MTEWTIITLKEHFEALRLADQIALKLQAEKYEDRLIKLNGEHATLAQMKDTYVPREVYDRDMDRARSERGVAQSAVENARVQMDIAATANRRSTVIAISGVAIALVGWVITIALRFAPGNP